MITLKENTDIAGDCTCGFEVTLDKEYTVIEFINTILSERKKEWGYFIVNEITVEYRHGELLDIPFNDEILQSKMNNVSAWGGWTRMDYRIEL